MTWRGRVRGGELACQQRCGPFQAGALLRLRVCVQRQASRKTARQSLCFIGISPSSASRAPPSKRGLSCFAPWSRTRAHCRGRRGRPGAARRNNRRAVAAGGCLPCQRTLSRFRPRADGRGGEGAIGNACVSVEATCGRRAKRARARGKGARRLQKNARCVCVCVCVCLPGGGSISAL